MQQRYIPTSLLVGMYLGGFSPRVRLISDSEVNIKTGAFTFSFETLPHRLVFFTSLFFISRHMINESLFVM